ncbi:MAG TPA: hypothetical protein VFK78_03700 [Gemmatimonadales bacterium]|nr:hypothetical protein [Gemmatimonadales bacterium]
MALEQLLAELTRRTESDAGAVLARAREEGAALVAAAEARRSERNGVALEGRERAWRDAAIRAQAAAQRDARRTVLEARARFLDRVFDAVARALPAAERDPAYRDTLARRVANARACAAGAPAELRCSPGLAPALRPLAPEGSGLRVEPEPNGAPGFRLVTDDGRLEVDETLEGRLARERAALSLVALAAFEKDGAQP